MKVSGIDEVVAAIRRIPSSLSSRSAYEEIASEFSARLRAATPPGYNRKLSDSVLSEVGDNSARVGYDQALEVAGRPELDRGRVTGPPRTAGRSVLRRWAKTDELETVLGEAVDAYAPEVASVMARRL
jgi:hypothetical protein